MPVTLLDTSVLARLLERTSPRGRAAEAALSRPPSDGDAWAVCTQVMTEFWVVATRPVEANGYGLGPADADTRISDLLELSVFLPDPPDLFERWRGLVVSHQVRGKRAHDARLVAWMQSYGVGRVLTFNPRDFGSYPGIEIVAPPVA